MTRKLRLTAVPLTVVALMALTGCGSKGGPAPSAPPPPAATQRVATADATERYAASAAPSATTAPEATALPQGQVTNVKVTEGGGTIQVSATLLDAEKRPVVGAVGDFFIEGSAQNLVQSYATKVDGSFSASFTTKELPPEATLMMHYRGDSSTAPGTFLLRKGTPRPSSAPPTATPTPAAPAPTPGASRPAAPPQPKAPRQVTFTDPDGMGAPRVTVVGPQARVVGRLITPADGHPVRNATVTWKVGNDATGQTTTATDGAFELTAELPEGAHEIVLTFGGTTDRAPTTVTVTV